MSQLKLYTEEQVKSMINRARIFDGYVGENFVYILSDTDIILAEAPIELPSDEEIGHELAFPNELMSDVTYMFIEGAKWMKEQILNQTK